MNRNINNRVNEAIILCGGFGTRLQSIVSDVPKPMADINGKPFLAFLLESLANQQIERVVLAVGYKSEYIEKFFGNYFHKMEIIYSKEDKPMGTGGAIKKALTRITNHTVFVLNGDTYFDIDFSTMANFHKEKNSDITIAVREVQEIGRYGSLFVDATNKIISFTEKSNSSSGLISGGIYCMNKMFFFSYSEDKFSIKKDFFEKKVSSSNFYAYKSDGYFVDIGIPEDYFRAQKEMGIK